MPDRAAAARDIDRRSADVARLEKEYGHLLADSLRLRRLPLNMLKSMPLFGFQPEAIDVRDRRSHKGHVVLEAFVRLRRSDEPGAAVTAFAHQVDALAGAVAAAEELIALSARVQALERQTSEHGARIDRLTGETERRIEALRQEIWYPRTPFERVYRRLGKSWRRFRKSEN